VPFIALVAVACTAHAEIGDVELGVDAGVTLIRPDDVQQNIVSVAMPASDFGVLLQNFRVGVQVAKSVQLQSSFGFSYLGSDDDSFYRLGMGLDMLFFPRTKQDAVTPYLRLGGLYDLAATEDEANGQPGFSVGVGVKIPAGGRFAVRLEGSQTRMLETDERAALWALGGSVGLSVFTK